LEEGAEVLYRVKSDRTTEWVDGIGNEIFESADAHRFDLDRLEWTPTQRSADDVTLRVALRQGRSSQHGIVWDPSDLDRGAAAGAPPDPKTAETIAEADPTLRAALRAEPDAELVEHWRKLGGTLPNPL
jgi:hypothetical protein